ncbi:MAG TPA: ABC transporter ATP-binding protein [Paludibacteraceae bacterium]|nr:ABC transporter ATP-binding protein [Paludibacteraceae bacterium]OPZ03300.1 MAG: Lipid A export ATP-binding/permease protein MsbA [Bacteroidetes bacterium ADurb.BinA395]MBP8966081.1 ABC transporter ATP-binding protein [Paludibacteraceae bacterium]HOJ65386.1 ABC transporter ATP-binding protein [Paludibacteraceae bacterium]HOL29366.1 ABC transporter ATP-binding protein [Paludibacteraceae bacterium]
MFKFFELLKRFIPPYKKYVFLNLLFNLLSTVFSLFSFAAIIPVLQILFGLQQSNLSYQAWTWGDGWNQIISALKNNIFYYLEQMMTTAGPSMTLLYLGLFLIVMTVFKTGTSYLSSYYIIPIRTGVLRDLRNQLYKKILSLPIGFFTEERKGDIMSRMTSDVTEIETSIISSLEMIFKNPIIILIYLTVMFAMSWKLTFFVLILLPLSGWLIGMIGKSLKQRSTLGQQQTGELLSQIEETLSGLRVIKAFNAEKKLEKRFAALNEKLRRTLNRINRRYTLAHPLSELLGTVVIAILLWFGGVLILENHSSINAAEFIYYLVIFYSIINPAKDLSKAGYSVQKGLASLERVDKILKAENTLPEPTESKKINSFNDRIEFKNVNFRYQSDWVLQDINLTIPKGKTVALVGQSGAGKSTLVDLLPRFYDVTEGEILIDGINIKDLNTKDIRSLMGNVNQEAILFNDTFFNNIAFGVENVTLEQVMEAAKIANAHDFIMASENGYQTTIGDRGSKLSGGQRQRISIARAILKNPPILILDEATSALDTESEKMVQEAIEKLMMNRTTLVIAHRLSTIKRADEICVMSEGKIVERGKHDELIALNGYYKRLYDMQSF